MLRIAVLMIVMTIMLNFSTFAQTKQGKAKATVTKVKTARKTSHESSSAVKMETQSKHRFFLHYINIVTGNGLYA